MNHTLTVSEETFAHLQRETKARGFETVEQYLEDWHAAANRRREVVQRIDAQRERQNIGDNGGMSRREVVRRIDELRERLNIGAGTGPDSTELIREDRNR